MARSHSCVQSFYNNTNMSGLFQYTPENELEIYRTYDRTLESFAEDVERVKEWVKTQPHLPEMPPDELIRSFLRGSKCSVERVKQRIDMYYTLRNFAPDMFLHPLSPEVREQSKFFHSVPLPKLTKDLYRVVLFYFKNASPDEYNPVFTISYAVAMHELRYLEDVSMGVIFILDFTNVTVGHMLKATPTVMKKLNALLSNAYSDRQKACHIIYSGTAAETVVSIVKAALRDKLKERVLVHKTYEALHDYYPKEMLPKDYGGEERSIAELADLLQEKFREYDKRYEELARIRTNEALRPGKPVNDEFFGFYGNFKKLEVD